MRLIIWEPATPVTTRHVAEYALAAKALDLEPILKAKVVEHVRHALTRLASKLSRGTFAAAFFIAGRAALGLDGVQLDDL